MRLTKDEVELGKLSIPDFLVHGVSIVDIRLHAEPASLHYIDHFPVFKEKLLPVIRSKKDLQIRSFKNLPCIVVVQWSNRDNHSLTRREPKGPFAWIRKTK